MSDLRPHVPPRRYRHGMASGKVLGGQHVDAPVDINRKGELTVQLRAVGQFVLKERPLSGAEVASWQEVQPEARGGALGLLGSAGQAAAGAALPGFVGRAASAALGAGVSAAARARFVQVEWLAGEQSLLRLPEKLFSHLRLTLGSLEVSSGIAPPAEPAKEGAPTATDQVFAQIAGLIGDRRAPLGAVSKNVQENVAQQLLQLATLRDQGALTEEEFVAAKTRLLG